MTTLNYPQVSQNSPLWQYLKKQRENKRFTKSVEISATLLFTALFALFAIKPAVTTISALVGEIKSKEILAKQMRQKINKIVEAQDKFSQVQEKYLIIESSLPSSPRYSHAASQFRGAGQSSYLPVNKISYDFRDSSDQKVNIHLDKYDLSIASLTDFRSLVNFIRKLSQNRRFFTLTSLSLSPDRKDQSEQTGLLNGSIEAEVYYWNKNNEKR